MAHPDLPDEQRYLDRLHARLEEEIERAERRLRGVRFQQVGGLHQSRFEREAFAGHLEERVATLRAHRRDDLCFGRIDLEDGRSLYIGRLGLADEEHEPLLVDWRAPAAAPFYQATPAEPRGVARRRHFLTRDRRVVAIEDEVLDADALRADDARSLRGEAALQYAMGAARTGRMREIAATLQAEQDEVIRSPLTPALLVQGGPGTGKTAVALHRAAYLLYTHRRQLQNRDLLVVGPNRVFLRYIERVLPSLGESGVELTAMPDVYAKRAWAGGSDPARRLKADPVMVDVVARAIATRERPLPRSMHLVIEGERVTVRPSDTRPVVEAGRRRRGRHNQRALYVHERLLKLVWRRVRAELSEIMEFEDFRTEMLAAAPFRRLSQRVWPVLTPEQLLGDLFGFPALLDEATRGLLDDEQRELLAHPRRGERDERGWSVADAPVLDEAAGQLGPIPPELDPASRRRSEIDPWVDEYAIAEAEYRRERLTGLGGGMASRQMLERRLSGVSAPGHDEDDEGDDGDEAVRRWRYAVVDESQDVSPMEWRLLGRHCPRRAATVVGDVAQGTESWSPESWNDVRKAFEAPDAELRELTINYRTPAEVSGFAARVLEVVDPALRQPSAVRSVEGSFATRRVASEEVSDVAVTGAVETHDSLGEGTACVVAAASRAEALRDALEVRLGRPVPDPRDPGVLDAAVAVMTSETVKGLEFDVVAVADPDALVAEAGWRALYVAVTRATQRLLVVHTGPDPLPARS